RPCTLVPLVLLSPAPSRHRPWYPPSGVVGIPDPAGSTVHRKVVAADAPVPSVAVAVTVYVPGAVAVPETVPPLEMPVPAGSPVAVKASVCPGVVSLPDTVNETPVPATLVCPPGPVTVTGSPSCAALTDRAPASGRSAAAS